MILMSSPGRGVAGKKKEGQERKTDLFFLATADEDLKDDQSKATHWGGVSSPDSPLIPPAPASANAYQGPCQRL